MGVDRYMRFFFSIRSVGAFAFLRLPAEIVAGSFWFVPYLSEVVKNWRAKMRQTLQLLSSPVCRGMFVK